MYLISRNATGKPTLMHTVDPSPLNAELMTVSLCGKDFSHHSRAYTMQPLAAIMCKHCLRAETKEAFNRITSPVYLIGGAVMRDRAEPSSGAWDLPLHRAGNQWEVESCGTCEGGGCLDCTDSAYGL